MKRSILSVLIATMIICVAFAKHSVLYSSVPMNRLVKPSIAKTADVEADDDFIAAALVTRSDVDLTITNDATYPWKIDENEGALKNGNCGVANFVSSFTISFKSKYKTDIYFDWRSNNYNSHRPLEVFVDGDSKGTTSNSSYHTMHFYLDAGEHVIMFKDSIGNNSSLKNYSYIKNLTIKEIHPLETAVLTEDSKPVAFINDAKYPWTIEDGFIQNGNYYVSPSVSKISTTITVDTTSIFSFERQVTPSSGWSSNIWIGDRSEYDYYHYMIAYVDGEEYMKETNVESFQCNYIILEPGTHTIEWVDSVPYSRSTTYFSRLRNVGLKNDWLEIDLTNPGSLGVEVLHKVNVLTDVKLLKVKGTINDSDWINIKKMTNLVGLDLSETKFDAVPAKQFDGHGCIRMVKLPMGMTSIGAYAFRNSPIRTVNIPSTTQSIGEYAFYECNSLAKMLLPESLKSLGQYVFYSCDRLSILHFPEYLTTIPSNCCYGCYNLKDLRLPANLEVIGHYGFYGTSNLRKLHFPEKLNEIGCSAFEYSSVDTVRLPIKMKYLHYEAFANCSNLAYVELPAGLLTYDNGSSSNTYGYFANFYNCPSLKTIACKSVIPPTIIRDPFQACSSKNEITLLVPFFSVADYKLDTYWNQFGTIEAMAETPTYWKIGNDMVLYNDKPIDVKPIVELTHTTELGGSLIVRGSETLSMNSFTMHWSHNNQYADPDRKKLYCSLINNSNMRSDIVYIYMSTRNDQWTFFTVPFDVKVSDIRTYYEGATNWIIRKYDGKKRALGETAETWVRMNGDDILEAGEGYIIQGSRYVGKEWQYYSGFYMEAINNANKNNIFINTDATVQLKEYQSEFAHNRSWNLIGNPYPCYYDTRFMDFSAPITVWNMNNNTYTAYSPMDDSYILCPGEAFFVQCPVEDKDILFSKEGRQTDRTVRAMEAKTRNKVAGQAVNRIVVNLSLSDGTNTDKTRIVLNNEASLQYEMDKDASKFMSDEATVPQLYTSNSGVNYAINERPFETGVVDLCTRINVDGQYTLTLNNLPEDYRVELYDKKLNKRISLTDSQTYVFFAESGEDVNRFAVYFVNGATGISENQNLDEPENETYSIDGVKVNDSVRKGVYIRNGKKVIVK